MVKKISILIILVSSLPVYAQDNYKLLEPDLWGSFASNGSITFVNFIERSYAIFLSLCIIAAFVLIIWHGLNYMVSNVPLVKATSKGRMWTAIQGLVLALTAYLLLYTINPNLVNLNLNFDEIIIRNANPTYPGGGPSNGGGTPNQPPGTDGCPTCVKMSDYNIPIQGSNACGKPPLPSSECTIDPNTAEKLAGLNQTINSSAPDIKWEVTEAYPPTRVHKNPCHQQGTCVDVSLRSEKTGTALEQFADSARSNGLRPVYEVKTEARKTELLNQGYTGEIKVLGDWITGEHFSIYAN